MSKRAKILVPSAALALVFALGVSLALAEPRGPHGRFGHHAGAFHEFLAERLDLSEAQRADIDAVAENHRESARAQWVRVEEARQALHRQIHAEVFDEGAIRAAAAELGAVEAEAAVSRALMVQEIHQILTPEQRVQAREVMETMRAWHDARRERFHGRFDRPVD